MKNKFIDFIKRNVNIYIYIVEEKKCLKIQFFGIKLSFNLSVGNNAIYLKTPTGKLKKVRKIKGLKVVFKRSNSKVIVHEPIMKMKNCKLIMSNNCYFELGAKTKDKLVRINNVVFDMCGKNSKIIIGDNLFFGSGHVTLLDNSSLSIGDDCLFSSELSIRTGDGHKIYDLNKNEQIPDCGNIIIGDRVWIGLGATLLKNAGIASDSIVGTSSVVAKKFSETNIAIAGNPARIIKTNIAWEK